MEDNRGTGKRPCTATQAEEGQGAAGIFEEFITQWARIKYGDVNVVASTSIKMRDSDDSEDMSSQDVSRATLFQSKPIPCVHIDYTSLDDAYSRIIMPKEQSYRAKGALTAGEANRKDLLTVVNLWLPIHENASTNNCFGFVSGGEPEFIPVVHIDDADTHNETTMQNT